MVLSASAGISQAAVTFSGIANNTGFTVNSTTPLTIVNGDINVGPENPSGGFWGVMDDGAFGGTDKSGGVSILGEAGPNGLLYRFTDGASTIGSISMYSGWNDNGRMEQHFSVYTTTDVSVTGASTWTLLATVGGGGSNGSTQFAGGSDTSLKTTIYNDASSTLGIRNHRSAVQLLFRPTKRLCRLQGNRRPSHPRTLRCSHRWPRHARTAAPQKAILNVECWILNERGNAIALRGFSSLPFRISCLVFRAFFHNTLPLEGQS